MKALPPNIGEIAMVYWKKHGLSVIPVGKDKTPFGGLLWKPYQSRLPLEGEVHAWWAERPQPNVAIITGSISDLTVIDCDSPEAVTKIESFLPKTLQVPTVITPRGGRHFYFRCCSELRSKSGVHDGIDIKSEGGYILCPPSKTEKGDYVWSASKGIDSISGRPPIPFPLLEFLKGASGVALGQLSAFPPLSQGRRDIDLFNIAIQLFRQDIPEDAVVWTILELAKKCEPPFPEKEALAKIKSAKKYFQDPNPAAKEVRFIRRKFVDIEDTPIVWAWKGIIPMKMVTAITGDPGVGKTFVLADIAARISQGTPFPPYQPGGSPVKGNVIYISSEGVPESILKPRMRAAGADINRIDIIEGVYLKDGEFSVLDIQKHLPQLEKECSKDSDLRLVEIDPIASFLPPTIDERSSSHVRQAMDLLSNFADKTGVAVVVAMHFNKDLSQKTVNRTSGSVQFMAAVKSSWSVVHKKGDLANRRFLVPQKSNLVRTEKSLPFTIESYTYQVARGDMDTAKIVFEAPVQIDVEAVVSPQAQPPMSMTAKAREFLRGQLSDSRKGARELCDQAEERGINKNALWKAKRDLSIVDERSGFQSKSYWRMPDKEE
ncbi:MAG: AAA family ATPase [Candidatus Aminicenantales bacterium]